MATATVLAPSSHYPQSSYSSYPQHSSGAAPPPLLNSAANMISSEHRRSADEKDQPGRQSLPSISEVISATRSGQYGPPTQTNMQPGSGLPSPFTSAQRPYLESEKHSPQQLHTPSAYPPRQENLPAFTDSPRPPFNGRHSLPPVSDRRQIPPTKPDFPQHRLAESQKQSDSHASNGAYGHPPPPTSHPYPPGHLPPGQVPLPAYPISPRHAVPPPPGQYDSRGQPVRHEEAEYSNRSRFEPAPPRHFETWSYQEALSCIGTASRTIFSFAEAYGRIAQEQHGSHPIPERLPTEREVNDVLGNMDMIKRSLEQVKDLVQASIQSERAREGTKIKGAFEEEHQDVPMYDNGMKPQYTMTEVKKRRGRAAHPGRCHSCNRIDTPEWRRGPDGARTLCNACGLHYAKLERKRQLEARSIRPKPEDRN
ncbi:GATA-type sexual development transcription factor NsdD [Metarhizium album ARSEF 1941]|uniref:GATA-type sexual development transcription factor NsdD n=1 Tax=Metarhizium album (strain ARSEF 1941) TaxID=1081103 RepID=A0A0B2WLI1_METAS|nr:GATA-type sexual development transcription factor NsdD [Metarhizium album ARSEF 1941]KHN94332.1 GATA-type sexual development transcription factor NsdD [Metarhizium album ARSEF 1941]